MNGRMVSWLVGATLAVAAVTLYGAYSVANACEARGGTPVRGALFRGVVCLDAKELR